MPEYVYDRWDDILKFDGNVANQKLDAGFKENSHLLVIRNDNGVFPSPDFEITLLGGEIITHSEDRGSVTLKTCDGVRDRLDDRYTLFRAELRDIKINGLYGPHMSFSAWAVDEFEFYPNDWKGSPTLVNGGDEHYPPAVSALNLPRKRRPVRVSIEIYIKNEGWTINGL